MLFPPFIFDPFKTNTFIHSKIQKTAHPVNSSLSLLSSDVIHHYALQYIYTPLHHWPFLQNKHKSHPYCRNIISNYVQTPYGYKSRVTIFSLHFDNFISKFDVLMKKKPAAHCQKQEVRGLYPRSRVSSVIFAISIASSKQLSVDSLLY